MDNDNFKCVLLMTITQLADLNVVPRRRNWQTENHEIDLDVLMMKNDDGEYIVPPVHCQQTRMPRSCCPI